MADPEVRARIQEMRRQLEELERRVNTLPIEPPDGSVVRFTKRFPSNMSMDGRVYSYAAIRVEAAWYLTGGRQDSMTWDQLCEFATGSIQLLNFSRTLREAR